MRRMGWEDYGRRVLAAVTQKVAARGERCLEADEALLELLSPLIATDVVEALSKPPLLCRDCGAPIPGQVITDWCLACADKRRVEEIRRRLEAQ